MADAEKIMQGLAQIAVEHPGCDGVISDAIALIERLKQSTPHTKTVMQKLNDVMWGHWSCGGKLEIQCDCDAVIMPKETLYRATLEQGIVDDEDEDPEAMIRGIREADAKSRAAQKEAARA